MVGRVPNTTINNHGLVETGNYRKNELYVYLKILYHEENLRNVSKTLTVMLM